MTSKKWIIAAAAVFAICSATSILAFAKDNAIKKDSSAAAAFTANDQAVLAEGGGVNHMPDPADISGGESADIGHKRTVSAHPSTEDMIAESDDKSVHITGTETNEGIFDHLMIETSAFKRSMPGYNVTNPNYAPEIILADLNGDGTKEIVVILTTGYGTGVYRSDVVVYNSEGNIIPVEDANAAFSKQFGGSFSAQGLDVNVQGQRYHVPYTSLLSDRDHLNERPQIGSFMQYAVDNGSLTATAAVQISPAEFVGDLTMTYRFTNGTLQAGKASFELYPEYGS